MMTLSQTRCSVAVISSGLPTQFLKRMKQNWILKYKVLRLFVTEKDRVNRWISVLQGRLYVTASVYLQKYDYSSTFGFS